MKATGGSAPKGPEPLQLPDPLPDLLDLASQEGALQGEKLASFLEALRARARLVVAERVERLEERLRSLDAELAWRRESVAALEENVRALGQQAAGLAEELSKVSDELRRVRDAHDALLAHHRQLVDAVATQLVSIASLSPLRARQARTRLLALAELLRADSR